MNRNVVEGVGVIAVAVAAAVVCLGGWHTLQSEFDRMFVSGLSGFAAIALLVGGIKTMMTRP